MSILGVAFSWRQAVAVAVGVPLALVGIWIAAVTYLVAFS